MDDAAARSLDLDEDEGVADDDDDTGDGPRDEKPVGTRLRLRRLVEKVTLLGEVAPPVVSVHLTVED